jgi:titin
LKKITKKALALILAPVLMFGGVAGSVVLGAAPAYAATPQQSAEAVQIILADTNAYRVAAGLPPLRLNSGINSVAQAWSEQQANERTMYHNPNYSTQIPAGWYRAGENVASGYQPSEVTNAWFNSPTHKVNLLGDFSDIGIGYFIVDGIGYFTQNFANYSTSKTIPQAPAAPNVTAGSGSISGSWTAPAITGNQPLTGYDFRVIPTGGGTPVIVSSTTTSATISGLATGVQYDVDVRAKNATGPSTWSEISAASTLAGPPAAPSVSVGTPTSSGVTVNWTGADGGAAITSWTVTLNSQANRTVTSPSTAYTGLTPATVYNGTVTATNSVGTSAVSAFSFKTAVAPPSAARSVTLTQSGTTTTVNSTWLAPTNNGGGTVIGYDVSLINVSTGATVTTKAVTGTSTSFTVAKGSTYRVSVVSKNTAGTGPAAVSSDLVVALNVANSPTNVTANLVDEQIIDLTWATPTDNGGTAITGYLVSAYANGSTTAAFTKSIAGGTVNATTLTATQINSGTSYTFKVAAVNSVGNSANSSASAVVDVPRTPTAPDAPTAVKTSSVTSTSATIAWVAPEYNGGSAITGYNVIVTDSNNGTIKNVTVSETTSTLAVAGLIRGNNYMVTVSAINARGTSANAAAAFATLLEKPSAPFAPLLSSDDSGILTAEWTAPSDDGGKAISSYRVELITGGVVVAEKTVTTTNVMFSDAATSTVYSVRVFAKNTQFESNGATSNEVSTPTPPSDAQNVVLSVTGSRTATATWSAPLTEGTKPLASYKVDVYDVATGKLASTKTVASTVTTVNFTGLNPGTVYFASVQTFSTLTSGNTAKSANVKTDAEAPQAVTALNLAIVNSTSITATWTAPTSNGGSAITGYNVVLTSVDGTQNFTATSPMITIPNLNPVTAYTVTVSAVNAIGSSATVSDSITTSAVAPSAPRTVEAAVNGTTVNSTWVAPSSNGGATITGYIAVLKNAANGATVATQNVTTTSASFTGLDRAQSYFVVVSAKNTVGTSPASKSATVAIPAIAPSVVQSANLKLSGATAIVATWAAPANNGGATVTGYTVTLLDGATVIETRKVSILSTTFENLNPVTTYTVSITATNSAGTSTAVEKTITTEAIAASAPVNVVSSAASNVVSATWTAPAKDGGATVTGYTATLVNVDTNMNISTKTVTSTNVAFSNVPRGKNYKVVVVATNSAGVSVAASSNTVHVDAIISGAPSTVNLSLDGSTTIVTKWTAPVFDGGSAITGYKVTILNGTTVLESKNTDANTFTVSFAGLNPVTEYTVEVAAINSVGTSTAASKSITTNAVASSAVNNLVATVSDTTVASTWTAPTSNGGATVTGYTATLVNANNQIVATKNVTSEEVSFSNVARGQNYTVKVTATNSAGNSPAATSNEVTVEAVISDAPATATAETVGDQEVTVTWTAPKYNGGSVITSYLVTMKSELGEATREVTGDTLSVTLELAADTAYTFSVLANNAKGASVATNVAGIFLTAPADAPVAPSETVIEEAPEGVVTQKNANTVSTTLTGMEAGTWVYGYAYSTPFGLGWVQVPANGVIDFDISGANLNAGNHTLVIMDKNGNIIVAGKFVVADTSVIIPTIIPTAIPTAVAPTAAEVKKTQTDKATTLARTGVDSSASAAGAIGVLLLGMGLLAGSVAYKRRKKGTTVVDSDN